MVSESAAIDSAKAIAVFALNYTDIDISAYPPQPPGSALALFTSIGLVDTVFKPKPALATYDSIFARPLRNLRLSVTDRCNLRCAYCMPEEEYAWLPRADILTFEEIARLVEELGTSEGNP